MQRWEGVTEQTPVPQPPRRRRIDALDDAGVALVLVQEVPGGGEWAGVTDRLRRGAAERLGRGAES